MGKIQLIAASVQGDDAVIAEALRAVNSALHLMNADGDGDGDRAAPSAAGLLPGAPRSKKLNTPGPVECSVCHEPLKNRWQLGAHTRYPHPRQKRKLPAAGASSGEDFFCPVKNCAKSFKKRAWRDRHLKKDHGVEETV